jgi:hypothetical protein
LAAWDYSLHLNRLGVRSQAYGTRICLCAALHPYSAHGNAPPLWHPVGRGTGARGAGPPTNKPEHQEGGQRPSLAARVSVPLFSPSVQAAVWPGGCKTLAGGAGPPASHLPPGFSPAGPELTLARPPGKCTRGQAQGRRAPAQAESQDRPNTGLNRFPFNETKKNKI